MPLARTQLADLLVLSLEQAGLSVTLESRPAQRPLHLKVSGPDARWDLRVFLWNVTLGGPPGVRDPNEWRVQTTRPGLVPFAVEDDRYTLLLGYHEATRTIAAWEVRAHPNPGGSSSLQVSLQTLQRARKEGFASQVRVLDDAGVEVVVAFQLELIDAYLRIVPDFQAAVVDANDASSGKHAAEGDESAGDDLPLDQERRTAMRRVAQRVRDAKFRSRVLSAYGGRCAFCDLDLGLAEAAHISAVADDGPDLVTNGLAACPTHHRAFDRGLVIVGDDLTIVVNARRAAALGYSPRDLRGLAAGLRTALRPTRRASQRPDIRFLQARRRQSG